MASFRVLGQFVQYFLDDGTVNDGGSVTFYETDLTTLKDTWSDPGLTVLNPNPVPLSADGRLANDVWGSGVYGAVLADASSVTIQTLNNIQSGSDPGLVIPSLVSGDFLTNDGSNLLWQPVLQVPDPTGSAGQVLGTDGTLLFWQAVSGSTGTAGLITVGNQSIQTGSGSAGATSVTTTQASVVFSPAFSGTPKIFVTPEGTGLNNSWTPIFTVTAKSSTGFTVVFNSNSANPGLGNFTAVQNFDWQAIGPT